MNLVKRIQIYFTYCSNCSKGFEMTLQNRSGFFESLVTRWCYQTKKSLNLAWQRGGVGGAITIDRLDTC